MTITFTLEDCAAEAFRAGRMSLHCLPAPVGVEPPVLAHTRVEFVAKAPYGKLVPLGFGVITEAIRARLDTVSDDDIRAAGYPNWTLFSATWTALHGAKGFSWDVDPDAWMIRFVVDQ
ncbi:hypothetical protein [Stutzerimonas stutzeri]|uniref:hypothetical protein n=1 Tax=Stutzerimonas stutzeri TaxID=316 RepID=UPI00265D4AF2|nr:hypothetical protein [Stutzerimonas stutzeri]MCF6783383.1 hypothetical protein [Stutzerimonas stutzeri]